MNALVVIAIVPAVLTPVMLHLLHRFNSQQGWRLYPDLNLVGLSVSFLFLLLVMLIPLDARIPLDGFAWAGVLGSPPVDAVYPAVISIGVIYLLCLNQLYKPGGVVIRNSGQQITKSITIRSNAFTTALAGLSWFALAGYTVHPATGILGTGLLGFLINGFGTGNASLRYLPVFPLLSTVIVGFCLLLSQNGVDPAVTGSLMLLGPALLMGIFPFHLPWLRLQSGSVKDLFIPVLQIVAWFILSTLHRHVIWGPAAFLLFLSVLIPALASLTCTRPSNTHYLCLSLQALAFLLAVYDLPLYSLTTLITSQLTYYTRVTAGSCFRGLYPVATLLALTLTPLPGELGYVHYRLLLLFLLATSIYNTPAGMRRMLKTAMYTASRQLPYIVPVLIPFLIPFASLVQGRGTAEPVYLLLAGVSLAGGWTMIRYRQQRPAGEAGLQLSPEASRILNPDLGVRVISRLALTGIRKLAIVMIRFDQVHLPLALGLPSRLASVLIEAGYEFETHFLEPCWLGIPRLLLAAVRAFQDRMLSRPGLRLVVSVIGAAALVVLLAFRGLEG